MPTIQCQYCRKPIDYTDMQAGKSIPCPSCGETVILPTFSGVSASAADRAAIKGFPPSTGPEEPVMVVRQAMFGAKPFAFLILWLGILGGVGGGIAFFVLSAIPLAGLCAGIGVICLATLFLWRLSRQSRRLEITTKRVIDRQGFVSRRINEVLIKDIRDIQVVQGFGERLMGIGRLSISTAGQSDYEIEIADVPNPNKIREVIDLYRGI